MSIRHYRPGDENAQVAIYNAATATLPKFKPATTAEVLRRVRARDFDPATHLYAEDAGSVVGYAIIQANGRVSHPWCLPGHEQWAGPLFEAALSGLAARGVRQAFAAYREDWQPVLAFFERQGFRRAREMVNFFVPFEDLPTPSIPSNPTTPLTPADLPEVLALAPEALRVEDAAGLERALLRNPYVPPESVFVLRSRSEDRVLAVGVLVQDVSYADPRAIDPQAPCFRNGAFGTEGMQTKRVNGLFSVLARQDRTLDALVLEMLGQAAYRVEDDTIHGFAAQVPSDAAGLFEFYRKHFRRQGAFPVLERTLEPGGRGAA